MHDQADQLRKLVRDVVDVRGDLAPGAPVIAVTGARPASASPPSLAACARTRPPRQASRPRRRQPRRPRRRRRLPRQTPRHARRRPRRPRRAVEILAPGADNIRILAGARHADATHLNREAIARLQSELAAVCRQSDVVLIDAGDGMNPWIDRLWQLAATRAAGHHAGAERRPRRLRRRQASPSTTASTASCSSSSRAATTAPTPPACTPAFAATVRAVPRPEREAARGAAHDLADARRRRRPILPPLGPPARRRPRLRLPRSAVRLPQSRRRTPRLTADRRCAAA